MNVEGKLKCLTGVLEFLSWGASYLTYDDLRCVMCWWHVSTNSDHHKNWESPSQTFTGSLTTGWHGTRIGISETYSRTKDTLTVLHSLKMDQYNTIIAYISYPRKRLKVWCKSSTLFFTPLIKLDKLAWHSKVCLDINNKLDIYKST